MAPGFTFEVSGTNLSPGSIQINGVDLTANGIQTSAEPGVTISGGPTANAQPQVCVYDIMLEIMGYDVMYSAHSQG